MLELKLVSDPAVLPDVRDQVRDWTSDHGWSEHQIGEITLALDEALSNVIRHGYGGKCDKAIHVTLNASEADDKDDVVEITVRDFCENVDLDAIRGRPLDEVRPGGLGVHLIRAMMEEVEYAHADGGGVLLMMRKSKSHYAADAGSGDGAPKSAGD